MFRIATFIILLATSPLGTSRAQEADGMRQPDSRRASWDDLAKLQGVWDRVGMEVDGLRSAGDGAGWTATYEGDRLTLATDGEHYRTGLVSLDASRSPRAINTWDLDGPGADETYRGIYELDGDTLKVCFARPGKKRPAEFKSGGGEGFLCYTYKRRRP